MGDGRLNRALEQGRARTTEIKERVPELRERVPELGSELRTRGTELRTRGLMYRDSLGADRGMPFVYPDEQMRGFWMKNTRIPLDIAFADSAGRIVWIDQMAPLDTDSTSSRYPAKYALEMNQGWFAAHGVAVGATLADLPEITPE